MRIRAFHIDCFGMLSQVTVDDLPRGMGIFLGDNEAGKSTCLEFFRATLTGYPSARSREGKKAALAGGGRQGGTLHLETEDGARLRLTRQPSATGGVPALYDAQGNPLDATLLDRLLGGASREVYRSIYGFSLSELQTFETLDSDAVRDVLYGAGFGQGINSPGSALSSLEEDMALIFKPGGKNPPLNAALRQRDELRRELRAAEEEAARYDAVAAEWEDAGAALSALHAEKDALEAERRELDRRINVWDQWNDWRLTRRHLERLEPVAASFPLDGPSRLERLLEARDGAQRQTAIQRERLARIDAGIARLELDARLLPLAPEIKALAERKASCRNALIALPTLRAGLARAEEDLARQLASLGPSWNMDRIRAMDRSLFVREELERRAAALQVAETNIAALISAQDRALRGADEARHGAAFARQTLDALPEPVPGLDPTARERLHTQILRLEESRQRLPERQKALAAARAEYGRAFSYLHIAQNPSDASGGRLAALADAQEQALALAADVRERAENAAVSQREAQACRKEEEAAAARLQRIQVQERGLAGTDWRSLDARRAALRRLRQSSALLQREEERLADLSERYAAQEAACPRPRPDKSRLALGGLLSALGAAALTARIGFGLTSLPFGDFWARTIGTPPPLDGELPLIIWACYLVLFVGIILLATGRPHAGPDRERNEIQLDQMRSRRDASAARLAELRAEVQALCDELDASGCDAAALDALEAQLDREREQCSTNERLLQEKDLLQAELDAKRRILQAREAEHAAAESAAQTARRRWHDFFLRLGVASVPLPEAAAAYFARVESTRMARVSMAAIEDEIRDLQGRGDEFAAVARDILPADLLPSPGLPGMSDQNTPDHLAALTESVRRVLDACRQADTLGEERARAAEALRAAEAGAARADEASQEAEHAVREAVGQRANLLGDWADYLQSMGLSPRLSPATAREALDCMERCLATEAECRRIREDLALHERERDALADPLAAMLGALGRAPRLGLDREPDWLGTLDILQRDAEGARHLADDKERLYEQKEGQLEELHAAEAREGDAQRALDELLALGGAEDPEHFRRLAAVHDETAESRRRCQLLEDTLRLAAGDVALEDFLREFEGLEKNALLGRQSEVQRRLETLRDEEQRQAAATASLAARRADLISSRSLADLRIQEAALDEHIRTLAREWSRFALARRLLSDARRHFEKERQPEVVRLASTLFADITGGAWPLVTASLDDRSLRVVPPHGDPMPPELLSRGAQEQLYLALRLAHIQSRRAEPLPVIMDDILVNFDPTRTDRTIRALASLTGKSPAGPGHQILFFTCHPAIAEKLRAAVPDSALFSVDKGRIAKVG